MYLRSQLQLRLQTQKIFQHFEHRQNDIKTKRGGGWRFNGNFLNEKSERKEKIKENFC